MIILLFYFPSVRFGATRIQLSVDLFRWKSFLKQVFKIRHFLVIKKEKKKKNGDAQQFRVDIVSNLLQNWAQDCDAEGFFFLKFLSKQIIAVCLTEVN